MVVVSSLATTWVLSDIRFRDPPVLCPFRLPLYLSCSGPEKLDSVPYRVAEESLARRLPGSFFMGTLSRIRSAMDAISPASVAAPCMIMDLGLLPEIQRLPWQMAFLYAHVEMFRLSEASVVHGSLPRRRASLQ